MIASDEQVTSWTAKHCSNGDSTCQTFGHCDNIRHNTIVFPTEKLSCTTHTSLHLVADHHKVTLVTPLAHSLYKFLGTRPDAALALNCFDKYADCIITCSLLQRLQIVVGYLFETIGNRYPCCLIECLSGGGGSCQCAAVETTLHADDFIGAFFMDASKFPCEFDRSLNGFCAAV